jgi:predicted phage terminase large subunit-like protein
MKNKTLQLPRTDLSAYAAALWPPFEMAHHHRTLIDTLERVESGIFDRVMILMPPRHGKSLITSTLFTAWYLGRHPDKSIIASSYGQELASDFGRRVRGFVSDSLHRSIFPDCIISDDSDSVHRFHLTAGGAYFAVGAGGPLTGRGADLLLIDDPIKSREDANSVAFRRSLQSWYESTAYTRLEPAGRVVVIATRWHEADLVGWLLKEHTSEGWKVISMPAIAETNEDWRREGDPLWPSHFPPETLDRIKEAIGSSAWVSLYQQRPAPEEGNIFHRDWWRRYSEAPPQHQRLIFSLDCAYKAGKANDFSVVLVMAETKVGYYLLHVSRGRWEFPELRRQAVALADIWKPNSVLIEDTVSGISLVQSLKAETRLPVLPVKPQGDKQSRAHAVSPLVESGRVFLPESAPWLADFLDEATAFPASAHDDMVDALTQALNYLRGNQTWSAADGGYQTVQRSVWAPSRRPMSVAEQDRLDDSQADIDRMRRRSGWASRWGLRGHCW